ncbi:MAG: hypothetical protein V1702_05215 [Candidatus Woesearchaeota archaeon]
MANKIMVLISALLGSILLASQFASADLISGPETYIIGGIGLLVVIGIPVGVIALISYLIIRLIRKRHHPLLSKSSGESKEAENVTK